MIKLPITANTKIASPENRQGYINGADLFEQRQPPLTVSRLAASGCLRSDMPWSVPVLQEGNGVTK